MPVPYMPIPYATEEEEKRKKEKIQTIKLRALSSFIVRHVFQTWEGKKMVLVVSCSLVQFQRFKPFS